MRDRNSRTGTTFAVIPFSVGIFVFLLVGVPLLLVAGNQVCLLSQAAGHLLNNDLLAELEPLNSAAADDDSEQIKQLLQSFSAVSKMPEIFLEYFRSNIGKEPSVAFRGGTLAGNHRRERRACINERPAFRCQEG